MGSRDVTAILFDFGNTLFSHAPLAATIIAAGTTIGAAITADEAADLAARIDVAAAAPVEQRHQRDLDAAVWHARWHVLYALADDRHPGLGAAIYGAMHDPQQWIPFARTAAVLDELHRSGRRIGVLSNTGWDVRAVLHAYGLQRLISTFTLSYEVGAVKPASEIFAAACRSLDADPGDVVMVGDDPSADVGGVPLGIRTMILPPSAQGTDNGLDAVLGVASE